MATEDSNRPEPQMRNPRPHRTGWEPIIGILVVVALASYVLDGSRFNASSRDRSTSDATFSGTALLGGLEKHSTSSAFRGGNATAVMGGIQLDLRGATMAGNEATIDVSAIMGGVEIRVPRKWKVVNRIVPVLGGVTDTTASSEDGSPRLVIEGVVLMGGLDIKN